MIVLVLGVIYFILLFFEIPFCCYNDIYEMFKKCKKQKIKSAIKTSNYVECKVLNRIKWKINVMLTLRNSMNKLQ